MTTDWQTAYYFLGRLIESHGALVVGGDCIKGYYAKLGEDGKMLFGLDPSEAIDNLVADDLKVEKSELTNRLKQINTYLAKYGKKKAE